MMMIMMMMMMLTMKILMTMTKMVTMIASMMIQSMIRWKMNIQIYLQLFCLYVNIGYGDCLALKKEKLVYLSNLNINNCQPIFYVEFGMC